MVVVGQVRVGAAAARELRRKVLGGAEQRVAVVPRDAARRHEKVHVPAQARRGLPPAPAAVSGAHGGGRGRRRGGRASWRMWSNSFGPSGSLV